MDRQPSQPMTSTIGECLYALDTPYDSGPDRVVEYPVVSITERYVWVNGILSRDQNTRFRLDRAELESAGKAYSRALREFLYVRPQLDWPVFLVSSSPAARPSLPSA